MTRQRKSEIRRIAYDKAARELSAVIDWEWAVNLFDDADERTEFEAQLDRIVRELEAKGQP